jgi:hexosaminidase
MATQLQRYATLGVGHSDDAFRVAMIPRGPIVGGKVPLELSKQVGIGEIRYTTNGSEPTPRSQVYLDIIDVQLPVTLKATVFRNGTPLSATMTVALDTASVAALASQANAR